MAGITRILNDHYNSNIANFESDIESENLKTVMLKIGERPVGDVDQYLANVDQYLAKLPNYKQKRLQGIKKLSARDKRVAINKAAPQDFADFRVPYNNWGNYHRLGNKQKGDLLTKLGLHNQVGLENWEETEKNKISKLKDLDHWFTGYGQTRRFILSQIYASWCDEKGEYCKSSQDIFALIKKVNKADKDKLSIATYNRIIDIEKAENRENLEVPEKQELTNAFHNWVRDFVQKDIAIINEITAAKMDRLRPNLYEDVSSGLVGFFRKLIRAECQYEIELPKLRTFIDRLKTFNKACDPQFSDWDKSDIYGEIIEGYLNQSFTSVLREAQKNNKQIFKADYQTKGNSTVNIYLEFLQAIRNAESLKSKSAIDLLRFNNVYNQLRTTCELIKHHVKQQKDFELMFKKKDKIVKLITTNRDKTKTLIEHKATEDGIFAKIDPIFFDPKTSFPQYRDKNTINSLYRDIDNLYKQIASYKSNQNLSIIEITKKKIFKAPFLFIKNKILNNQGKLIQQTLIPHEIIERESKSPNGFAHEVFNRYYILAKDGEFNGKFKKSENGEYLFNKYNKKIKILEKEDQFDCYRWATVEIKEKIDREVNKIYDRIECKTIDKEYTLLRDLAGWIWVEMRILIEEIIDYSVRDRLIKEISQLASRISGFAYNLERDGFENQSIYLSDFYTKPESSDKFSNEFKSNCYLYTNESKNSLGLALDFENTIKQKNNSLKKALVYTFDSKADVKSLADKQILPKWNPQDDKINKDGQLVFFDYEYWNKKMPLAYKSFTKPNTDITIADSTFNFPLHFGKNQSRKYFWNKSRGTAKEGQNLENQVHHIFESNSRLKVSSMRLIRKHNPIKEAWEYYLSLAIYRLEEAGEKCMPTVKNEIVGYDIGENSLVEFGIVAKDTGYTISQIGNESSKLITKSKTHITGHKTKVANLYKVFKDSMENNNFIVPKDRKKMKDKTLSVMRQTTGAITKLVVGGSLAVTELDYVKKDKSEYTKLSRDSQIAKFLMFNLNPRASEKLRHEINPNLIFQGKKIPDNNVKIDIRDLLGAVSTSNTSQICSNCGHKAGDFINYVLFYGDLKTGMTKFALRKYINTKLSNKSKLNEQIERTLEGYSKKQFELYKHLYEFDIAIEDNPYADCDWDKLTVEHKRDSKKIRSSNKSRELIQKLINSGFSEKLKKEFETSDYNILSHRPKWYYGDIEEFRCLICGYFCKCDYQASINIARFRYFENSFTSMKKNTEFKGDAKLNDKNTIILYQIQLQKHGYDDHGNSKWNIS